MTDTLEQKKQLEKLLLSEDFEELNLKTNHFNIFNALKLQNAEIRHSNFLGWLMAPNETHELGDYFLKEFLKSAIKDFSLDEKTELCLSDIALRSFDNAEIRREYKNIDILVVDNDNKFVCVVENKTWTDEHDNQLVRYAKEVCEEFPNYKKLFIFLTPPKEKIDYGNLIKRDEFDKDTKKVIATYYYVPMNYEQVFNVIDKTLRFNDKRLNADVKTFIEHYKKMIKRDIMKIKDKDTVELCRRIYKNHKNAIDMIVESTKDLQKEIDEILIKLINEDESLNLEPCANGWIRFTPKDIDLNNLKFAKCDWVASDKILMVEINNTTNNSIYVDLIIRQADDTSAAQENRSKLIELASKLFKYEPNGKKDSYAHILSKPLIEAKKYSDTILDENVEYFLKEALNDSGIILDFKNLVTSYNESK